MTQDEFLRTDPGDRENESIFLITMLKMEVGHQCEFIELGYKKLFESTSEIEFWFTVQGIVSAAANLSKIFWDLSEKPVATDERAKLRESLDVDDDSPFRFRGVRNHFEHIDQRIIEVVSDSESGSAFSFRSLPNRLFDDLPSVRFGEIRRGEKILRFFDKQIDLEALNEEAVRILKLLAPAA